MYTQGFMEWGYMRLCCHLVGSQSLIAEQRGTRVTLLSSLLSCAGKFRVSIWPLEAVSKKLSDKVTIAAEFATNSVLGYLRITLLSCAVALKNSHSDTNASGFYKSFCPMLGPSAFSTKAKLPLKCIFWILALSNLEKLIFVEAWLQIYKKSYNKL